jgi:hypothetical protein
MIKKTISIIIATGLTTVFLFNVLIPPSIFNLIPYSIHESFWKGGSGESNFIISFDILCGLLLFWIVYRIASKLIKL